MKHGRNCSFYREVGDSKTVDLVSPSNPIADVKAITMELMLLITSCSKFVPAESMNLCKLDTGVQSD